MIPLPPAPLTREDVAIWARVFLSHGLQPAFGVGPAARADREDAHLIWVAVGVAQYGPSAIELHGHKFRGWTLGTWSS